MAKVFVHMLKCLQPYEGESTLQGGQKCCHIVLFSRGVHVWTSTTIILEHIFPNFLHNMVNHNTKKFKQKEIFFSTYIAWFQNIFVTKKCTSCMYKCSQIFAWFGFGFFFGGTSLDMGLKVWSLLENIFFKFSKVMLRL
jgi:hypothetical protein